MVCFVQGPKETVVFNSREHNIRSIALNASDRVVHILWVDERGSALHEHGDVELRAPKLLQLLQCVNERGFTGGSVTRNCVRAPDYSCAVTFSFCSNSVVISRHHDQIDSVGGVRRLDCTCEQRLACNLLQVLERNPL